MPIEELSLAWVLAVFFSRDSIYSVFVGKCLPYILAVFQIHLKEDPDIWVAGPLIFQGGSSSCPYFRGARCQKHV